eukprot:303327-Rhodomonas_salina.3
MKAAGSINVRDDASFADWGFRLFQVSCLICLRNYYRICCVNVPGDSPGGHHARGPGAVSPPSSPSPAAYGSDPHTVLGFTERNGNRSKGARRQNKKANLLKESIEKLDKAIKINSCAKGEDGAYAQHVMAHAWSSSSSSFPPKPTLFLPIPFLNPLALPAMTETSAPIFERKVAADRACTRQVLLVHAREGRHDCRGALEQDEARDPTGHDCRLHQRRGCVILTGVVISLCCLSGVSTPSECAAKAVFQSVMGLCYPCVVLDFGVVDSTNGE